MTGYVDVRNVPLTRPGAERIGKMLFGQDPDLTVVLIHYYNAEGKYRELRVAR